MFRIFGLAAQRKNTGESLTNSISRQASILSTTDVDTVDYPCSPISLISLPSRTILDRTYSAQRCFIFSYFFFLFFFWVVRGRLNWLNCQLSSARAFDMSNKYYLLTLI